MNKTQLLLVMAILNAALGYGDFLMSTYLPPMLAVPTIVFYQAVVNALVIYFGTEQQPQKTA